MSLYHISLVIWLATVATQLGVAMIIVRKRFYRECPFFATYTAVHVVRSAVLLALHFSGWDTEYFYFFWAMEPITEALAFGVIYELFSNLLKPFAGILQISRLLWKWCLAILFLLAVGYSAYANAQGKMPYIAGMLAFEQGVHIVQAGLVIFLFLFSSALAITWRHYAFGIALGFGINASVDLAVSATLAFHGPSASDVYVILRPLTYLFTTALWFTYLVSPVPRRKSAHLPENSNLERWNEAVLSVMHR
jgi:hypothetical protein